MSVCVALELDNGFISLLNYISPEAFRKNTRSVSARQMSVNIAMNIIKTQMTATIFPSSMGLPEKAPLRLYIPTSEFVKRELQIKPTIPPTPCSENMSTEWPI